MASVSNVPSAQTAYRARPWVLDDLVSGLGLLDVWELPVEGDASDFEAFVELALSFDPSDAGSRLSSLLFTVRRLLGRLLRWDRPEAVPDIPGRAETTLLPRVPAEFRDENTVLSPALREAGFRPLLRAANEWAGEISNATVFGVLHLAWVPLATDRYQGCLAVYVKPRGALGRGYLRLIQPFRHHIVYPALTRRIGRAWASRTHQQ